MAGTKLSNLNPVTTINLTDNLLIARSNASYRVQAGRIFESLSGVRLAQNATANGIPVFKETINVTNGTKIMFHSLSADTGINATLAGDVIKFTIPNNSIDTNKIINFNVTEGKIANLAISNGKIANGAVTPVKMSGTLYSVSTKTDIQTIPVNRKMMVTGLSATVTPPTVNSVVMINGSVSIGAIYGAINLVRRISNQTPVTGSYIALGDASGNISRVSFSVSRANGDYLATACPISFIDTPNTTLPVTYAIEVESLDNYITYVNRGYYETNAKYSARTISQIGAVVLP